MTNVELPLLSIQLIHNMSNCLAKDIKFKATVTQPRYAAIYNERSPGFSCKKHV